MVNNTSRGLHLPLQPFACSCSQVIQDDTVPDLAIVSFFSDSLPFFQQYLNHYITFEDRCKTAVRASKAAWGSSKVAGQPQS